MKILHVTVVLATALMAASTVSALSLPSDSGRFIECSALNSGRWAAYKKRFDKSYSTPETERRHCINYVENMAAAATINKLNPKAAFGENAYTDMSQMDFKTRHQGEKEIAATVKKYQNLNAEEKNALKKTKNIVVDYTPMVVSNSTLPVHVDWRKHGAVTPVKNQGQCGSCWAFSTTGNVEGQWAIAGHNLTSLSEQMLVSCADFLTFGCSGGSAPTAYEWIIKDNAGRMATEASYPYESGMGSSGHCQLGNASFGIQWGALVTGGKILMPWRVREMMMFIANEGPLSVIVDASSFQSYTSGIMTTCTTLMPDHVVLIVGYDTAADGTEFWIVKNSWGTSWGEAGYIRIERGLNLCQIELLPTSAVVTQRP